MLTTRSLIFLRIENPIHVSKSLSALRYPHDKLTIITLTQDALPFYGYTAAQFPDCNDHPLNEWFTTESCEKCKCNTGGGIACKPLCPLMRCPLGQKLETYGVEPMGGGCHCELKRCVPVRN